MKTSNKLLIGLVTVLMLFFLVLRLSYKPEYHNSVLKNVSDKFRVIHIENTELQPGDVIFTLAQTKEEAYIYYLQDGRKYATWGVDAGDTLRIFQPLPLASESLRMPLYLHLKGVEKILLNGMEIL